jgi:Fe-S-cluster-containing hydrogenase component 2
MDAFTQVDEQFALDADRCIGCGLCVTTCPSGALQLERKPDHAQAEVPANMYQTLSNLGRVRGTLTKPVMAKMQLKSKFDRLMASRKAS